MTVLILLLCGACIAGWAIAVSESSHNVKLQEERDLLWNQLHGIEDEDHDNH